MSSKYDKSVQISREEEGSYHRREIENTPAKPGYTTTRYETVVRPAYESSGASRSVRPTSRGGAGDTSSDDDNFEEWTTSKRKINHKTRQVETRVSRQLLVEDGKVIADSGPQVTTRIKEDNKVEECEKEKAPKNKAKFDAIECAPEGESSGRVLGEKKEIQKRSREVREENMQYHDERFKELTGHDVHRRAIQAPHELITINDSKSSHAAAPRGKMVHYSSKGKKYQDTDEILEVAKLAIDGSITKEVKRTKHHEEFSDDEKPDEKGEAEALREAPMVTRSNRKHFDYVNDFDDTSTPSGSSDDEAQATAHHKYDDNRARKAQQHHRPRESSHKIKKDEAFPRYERDPLLNSLNDDDFRPTKGSGSYLAGAGRHSGRYTEHSLERKDQSSDNERDHYQVQRHRSPSVNSSSRNIPVVEIPEEYRVNKQRLLSSKHGGQHTKMGSNQRLRDRSFSPIGRSSHRSHKEDASVQARLTDEEEERKSIGSSLSNANSHEKTTRKLQRQSTQNSQRNYYFGEKNRPKSPANQPRRKASLSPSSSSSSLSDTKASLRRHGARSKDSGFRSPHSGRTETPNSTGSQQQIYSVSSKAKSAKKKQQRYEDDEDDQQQHQTAIRHVASPTPTTGSLGQRSVKTTTTTMSAGLADRPLSRNERSASMKEGNASNKKVSKPPSPFQKLAKLFGPSNMKAKQAKAQANRQPVASR